MVDLPGSRAADDRRDLPRPRAEGYAADCRLFGPGVAEGDIAKLDESPLILRRAGLRAVPDLGIDFQHLMDAGGGGRGAGKHDEEEGDHEHGKKDLGGVLEERHEAPDLHFPHVDPPCAEPDDGHGGQVHHEHHEGEKQGHDLVDLDGGGGEVPLASSKRSLSWSILSNARTTRTPVSPSRITRLILSILAWMARNSGMPREAMRMMSAAMIGIATPSTQVRRASTWRAMMISPMAMMGAMIIMRITTMAKFCTWVMSLVVRVMRDSVSDFVELMQGEAFHVSAYEAAKVPPVPHPHPGGKIAANDGARGAAQRDQQHEAADAKDMRHIAPGDPLVHDVRQKGRKVQLREGIQQDHPQDHGNGHCVWLQVLEQLQHLVTSKIQVVRKKKILHNRKLSIIHPRLIGHSGGPGKIAVEQKVILLSFILYGTRGHFHGYSMQEARESDEKTVRIPHSGIAGRSPRF